MLQRVKHLHEEQGRLPEVAGMYRRLHNTSLEPAWTQFSPQARLSLIIEATNLEELMRRLARFEQLTLTLFYSSKRVSEVKSDQSRISERI